MDFLPSRAGPYTLLRPLGRGGSANVYAAQHDAGGPTVALKLLSPESSRHPHLVTRFLQEARALSQLQHPGVVRCLEAADHGGTVFLVMEYLEGQSLREWMRQRPGPVALEVLLEWGARIADILVEVHARGFVHRDLKPENVFLCPAREGTPGPHVTLLDFGIAKLPPGVVDARDATQAHTHDSVLLGSYPYMAPEQFRSAARVDASADVYALGVVLFELLAGRLPFVSEDPVELLDAHAHAAPPALHRLVPSLPPALGAFLTSLLAKEPARRPSMRRCRELLRRTWTDARERCPLPGLAPFAEPQAELFFGREEEVRQVLSRVEDLRAGPGRWLQVEGADGVGKSSLIQAGVLPRLALNPGWRVVSWHPRDEPLRALARALTSGALPLVAGETAETVERHLRSGPEALRDFAAAHVPEGDRLLLVVDPLEDVLTLGGAEAPAVERLLCAALAAPGSPVRLLSSLRSDFRVRLASLSSLAPLLTEGARISLPPLESQALTEALEGMAWTTGLRLERDLAARLVRESRTEANHLSLLGHALRRLWLASTDDVPLTHADCERLGGVSGALVQQAEALLDTLSPEGRERARWMLLSLVRTGRSVPVTRRPRARRDVLAAGGGDALAEQVLLQLEGRSAREPGPPVGPRLLQGVEGGAGEPRVELVHELLLSRVRLLAAWIEGARPWLECQADTEAAAQVWSQAKHPVEGLPLGTLLAHYQQGADPVPGSTGSRGLASPEVERFLEEARHLERRRTRTRRASALAAGLAVLAIVFFAAEARRQRQSTEAALGRFIEAADGFTGHSDWKLSWLPYTLASRKEQLASFRQGLEGLPSALREQLNVQRVLIQALQRQSDLVFHDGSLRESARFLDEAKALLDAALVRWPGDDDLRLLLALHHSKQGKVQWASAAHGSACAHFTTALRWMEQLKADGQTPVGDDQFQAVSGAELAECEILQQRWSEAARLLDRAIELHGRDLASSYNEALLAEVLGRRAEVALLMARREEAGTFFAQGLEHAQRSLERAPPGDQYSRWVLAEVLVKHARFQEGEGRGDEARREYEAASKGAETLRGGEEPSKRYALVLLAALAGQERRSPGLAPVLRQKRCDLVRDFHARDEEDARFRIEGCDDVHPSGGPP